MTTFRLELGHSYDPLSITHCLSLKAPRLTTPAPWHWAWPLQTSSSSNSPSNSAASPSALDTSSLSSSSAVRHVWVSAIRSVAVSDDANYVAFLSQHGAVALSRRSNHDASLTTTVRPSPHDFTDPQFEIWCQVATSLTFFNLSFSTSSSPSSKPQQHLILAVGYSTGAIAFFDPFSVRLLALSKLPITDPIRHLRFHSPIESNTNSPNKYNTSNKANHIGLFALAGWSGFVAHFPIDELIQILQRSQTMPTTDPNAAGWLVWNLSSQDAVLDVAPCGPIPTSPFEINITDDSTDENDENQLLNIITVGVNPPIVQFQVSPRPPFSARAAAARVATSFMSAAKGLFFSRLTTQASENGTENGSSHNEADEDQREAVQGGSSSTAAWVDDPDAYSSSTLKIGDSKLIARRTLATNYHAGLQKRPRSNSGVKALGGTITTDIGIGTARSASAPHPSSSPTVRVNASSKVREAASAAAAAATKLAANSRASFYGSSQSKGVATMTDAAVVKRVHSTTTRQDVAGVLARYTKNSNSRIVERVACAPYLSNLLASCDTLGRIMIQDPSDFCVLRILKGYRDANVAWIEHKRKSFLAVHAPRLDVIELHAPLEQKRKAAFRVLPGALLVQSTSHHAFCVFPDGRVFKISCIASETQKDEEMSNVTENDNSEDANKKSSKNERPNLPIIKHSLSDVEALIEEEGKAPDYELVGQFLEAVKSGRVGRAVECLETVVFSSYKVAHLMATLVVTTYQTRVDVHIALASKAGSIAAQLQNPDLVCRFEAHRRLAEGFQLIEAEPILLEASVDQIRASKYGARLIDNQLGSGLVNLAVNEMSTGYQTMKSKGYMISRPDKIPGDDSKTTNDMGAWEAVNCEQFILSHCLTPTVDLEVEAEYEILPRSDLSTKEQIWLAMAYFGKLLELDPSAYLPTVGREHPATSEIFAALAHYVGLSEAEITRQFVTFFLHAPLVPLLNTYVSLHASSLQCTIVRIRTRFTRDVVDRIVLDACETTNRVANAVLLARLFATLADDYEYDEDNNNDDLESNENTYSNPYVEVLDRLNEALVFQKLVSESKVLSTVREEFTARRFSGVRGHGELTAVVELLKAEEYERVVNILEGRLHGERKLTELSSKECALVSVATVEACRKKIASMITEKMAQQNGIIPKNVMTWIRSANENENGDENEATSEPETQVASKLQVLGELRAAVLAAHTYIPDSSVDAVRSLQLAEAISALIEAEERDLNDVDDEGGVEDDCDEFEDAKGMDEKGYTEGTEIKDMETTGMEIDRSHGENVENE